MKRINLIVSIAMIVGLFACRKEIKVDLNSTQPKLVIEANFIANDSIVKVNVSKTSDYFNSFSLTTINDAIVTIQQDNGIETVIPLVSDGRYELTAYAPNFGSNYTIKVTHNGTVYQSTSLLQPTLVLLPSYTEFQEASMFSEEGYWIYYRFQDFSGIGNCYKVITTFEGERFDKFGEFEIGNDKLTDGNLLQRPILEVFQVGDTVLLELQSINQKIYDYYKELSSTTSGFNAAVGNPNYLWTNQALGYFSAYSYSTDTVIITE